MKSISPIHRSLAAAIGMALLALPLTSTAEGLLVEINASRLQHSPEARSQLSRQFSAGVPILVHMDTPERGAVTRFFGVSPASGDAIFVRGADGSTAVLRAPEGKGRLEPHWSPRSVESLARLQHQGATLASDAATGTGNASVLPRLRFYEGVFDTESDEISGRLAVTVVRSAARTDDDKEIHVAAWPTITPVAAGIDPGHDAGRNLTAAYMPTAYRVSHHVTAEGEAPALVEYAPLSDERTEFEYSKSQERGINIGGSLGNGASEDGNADATLAAKIPFSFSVNFTHVEREELRFRFMDYSLAVRPFDDGRRVMWEAPLQERLKDVLVESEHADRVVLSTKRMTPMMRTATMPTYSVWEVPGEFNGIAKVAVNAGYDLYERKWWWEGPDWITAKPAIRSVDSGQSLELDLSSPYLTREITVLLRSADGDGACIAQRGGDAVLVPCDERDRQQMWGLDSERRYVNRQSGDCLQADVEGRRVLVATCLLANTQSWLWRADRIHSGFGDSRHRLFAENGVLKVVVDPGRFDDIPENPHNAILKPWTGYPRAPLEGELQPAPYGTQTGPIPAGWAGLYGATGPEQRWNPVVLRVGIGTTSR